MRDNYYLFDIYENKNFIYLYAISLTNQLNILIFIQNFLIRTNHRRRYAYIYTFFKKSNVLKHKNIN